MSSRPAALFLKRIWYISVGPPSGMVMSAWILLHLVLVFILFVGHGPSFHYHLVVVSGHLVCSDSTLLLSCIVVFRKRVDCCPCFMISMNKIGGLSCPATCYVVIL